MFSLLPVTLRVILASFLWSKQPADIPPPLTFELRHQHGISNTSRVVFSNIAPSFTAEVFRVNTHAIDVHRPSSFSAFSDARIRSKLRMESELLQWDVANVIGPDVERRETLLQLAKMTSNAYAIGPEDTIWYDLGSGWNKNYPFGWEPDADGFRGQVFVSTDNSTVIITVKGTSGPWIAGGGGPTIKKDKLNDNLLFSCCCAKVGPMWSTVCDCFSGGYTCDQTCLEKSLIEETLFYPIGTNLYNNVTYMYPEANIWIIGHSLGGSLASLLGVTFGVPVVAFEAPGEKMAASRLHLPSPPSTQHITHIFHTADPVPNGVCTGIASTCSMGGYAMESRCHLGQVKRYDTVNKFGWSVDLRTHPIKVVIDKILDKDWEPADENGKGGREVPVSEEQTDCVDCYSWEFGNFKNASGR